MVKPASSMDRDGFLSRRDGAVRRGTCGMNSIAEVRSSKVPEVTLAFWIIKILATTLGETGGYALSMTMNLGYAISTAIFFDLFIVTVAAQVRAKSFHPFLYWSVIVATITAGTTMADYADRSLGIGYIGGSLLLFSFCCSCLARGGSPRAPYRSQTSRRPRRKYSTGRRFSSPTRLEPLLAIFSPMIQG
jgi:Repeat of Unknown Function (DUF347)